MSTRGRFSWWLVWLALGLGVSGLVQLLAAQFVAEQLRGAAASDWMALKHASGWTAQAIASALAGLGQSGASVGLILARRWGWWLGLGAPLLGALALWAVRLTYGASPYEVAARPVDGLLTALGIALVWGLLWLPAVRQRLD